MSGVRTSHAPTDAELQALALVVVRRAGASFSDVQVLSIAYGYKARIHQLKDFIMKSKDLKDDEYDRLVLCADEKDIIVEQQLPYVWTEELSREMQRKAWIVERYRDHHERNQWKRVAIGARKRYQDTWNALTEYAEYTAREVFPRKTRTRGPQGRLVAGAAHSSFAAASAADASTVRMPRLPDYSDAGRMLAGVGSRRVQGASGAGGGTVGLPARHASAPHGGLLVGRQARGGGPTPGPMVTRSAVAIPRNGSRMVGGVASAQPAGGSWDPAMAGEAAGVHGDERGRFPPDLSVLQGSEAESTGRRQATGRSGTVATAGNTSVSQVDGASQVVLEASPSPRAGAPTYAFSLHDGRPVRGPASLASGTGSFATAVSASGVGLRPLGSRTGSMATAASASGVGLQHLHSGAPSFASAMSGRSSVGNGMRMFASGAGHTSSGMGVGGEHLAAVQEVGADAAPRYTGTASASAGTPYEAAKGGSSGSPQGQRGRGMPPPGSTASSNTTAGSGSRGGSSVVGRARRKHGSRAAVSPMTGMQDAAGQGSGASTVMLGGATAATEGEGELDAVHADGPGQETDSEEEDLEDGVRWRLPADVLRVMTPLDPWGRVVLDPSFELERLRHGAVLTYFLLAEPSATEAELTAAYHARQKRQGLHGSVGAHEYDIDNIPQLLRVDVDGLDEWTTDEEDDEEKEEDRRSRGSRPTQRSRGSSNSFGKASAQSSTRGVHRQDVGPSVDQEAPRQGPGQAKGSGASGGIVPAHAGSGAGGEYARGGGGRADAEGDGVDRRRNRMNTTTMAASSSADIPAGSLQNRGVIHGSQEDMGKGSEGSSMISSKGGGRSKGNSMGPIGSDGEVHRMAALQEMEEADSDTGDALQSAATGLTRGDSRTGTGTSQVSKETGYQDPAKQIPLKPTYRAVLAASGESSTHSEADKMGRMVLGEEAEASRRRAPGPLAHPSDRIPARGGSGAAVQHKSGEKRSDGSGEVAPKPGTGGATAASHAVHSGEGGGEGGGAGHPPTMSTVNSLPQTKMTSLNTTQMLRNSYNAKRAQASLEAEVQHQPDTGGYLATPGNGYPRTPGRALDRPAIPWEELPRDPIPVNTGRSSNLSSAEAEEEDDDEEQPALEAKDMYSLSGLPQNAARLASLFDEGATVAGGSLSSRIRDGAPLELTTFAVPRHLEEARAVLQKRRQSVRQHQAAQLKARTPMHRRERRGSEGMDFGDDVHQFSLKHDLGLEDEEGWDGGGQSQGRRSGSRGKYSGSRDKHGSVTARRSSGASGSSQSHPSAYQPAVPVPAAATAATPGSSSSAQLHRLGSAGATEAEAAAGKRRQSQSVVGNRYASIQDIGRFAVPEHLPLALETHRSPQSHLTGLGVIPAESDLVLDLLHPEVSIIRGGKIMDSVAKRIVEKQQAEDLDRRDVGATCLAFLELLGWAEPEPVLADRSTDGGSREVLYERELVRRPARRREYGWLEKAANAFSPRSPADLDSALVQLRALQDMARAENLEFVFPRARKPAGHGGAETPAEDSPPQAAPPVGQWADAEVVQVSEHDIPAMTAAARSADIDPGASKGTQAPQLPAANPMATLMRSPSGSTSARWSVKEAVKQFADSLYWRAWHSGVRWFVDSRSPRIAMFRLGQGKVVAGWGNVSSSLLLVEAHTEGSGGRPAGRAPAYGDGLLRTGSITSKRGAKRAGSLQNRSASQQSVDPLAQGPRPTGLRALGNAPPRATGTSVMEVANWKASPILADCWQQGVVEDAGMALTAELHAREIITGLYWGSVIMSHDLRSAMLDLWLKTPAPPEPPAPPVRQAHARAVHPGSTRAPHGGPMQSLAASGQGYPGGVGQGGRPLWAQQGGHTSMKEAMPRVGPPGEAQRSSTQTMREPPGMKPATSGGTGSRGGTGSSRTGSLKKEEETSRAVPRHMAAIAKGREVVLGPVRGQAEKYIRSKGDLSDQKRQRVAAPLVGPAPAEASSSKRPKTRRCGRPMVFMPQLARSIKVLQYEGCDVLVEQSLLAYRITRPKALWLSQMYLERKRVALEYGELAQGGKE